jgi:hypothetical protein
MIEIKDCLPESAKRHFINLRNIRLQAELERYRTRVSELRAQLTTKGMGRSGWQQLQEWKYKEEMSNSLATGFLQDAFETCELYEIPLTESLSGCLEKAVEDLLDVQYQNSLKTQASGMADVAIPLSAVQQGGIAFKKIMPQVRAMIEKARVEDSKKRAAMEKEKEKYGDTYTQNIVQHGGIMNASQTGNVIAQQLTVGEISDMQNAISQMRSIFKTQPESADNDEYVGCWQVRRKPLPQTTKAKCSDT